MKTVLAWFYPFETAPPIANSWLRTWQKQKAITQVNAQIKSKILTILAQTRPEPDPDPTYNCAYE